MLGGGIAYEQPYSTGKKVSGFTTRKDAQLSLGWEQSNQMNSYQMKKTKNHEITGKITAPVKFATSSSNSIEPVYDEALERQKLQQLYEKLAYENPDIPPQQLEQYVYDYDQQQRRSRKPESAQNMLPERRAPIKQKQSMRDIIYSGVGVESMEDRRAASRRNNSNMVLGDGYNHFQEGRR